MTKEQFTRTVSSFISRHRLLQTDGQYLVALSGGADSVALLLVLKSMGSEVEAVHCNFHLRGEESDRDEQFVISLCERHGVKLHRIHFDTRAYAQLHHVSIEMAARELRYRYFEQLRQDLGMNAVCVAHHRDDVVETVLMNLCRGAGTRGLAGIPPVRGRIVRPLLWTSREEIETYLDVHRIPHIEDSSNRSDDYTRNRIRHQIIPLLMEENPSFLSAIGRTAELLREDDACLCREAEAFLREHRKGNSIPSKALLRLEPSS